MVADGFYWATFKNVGVQTIVRVTDGDGGPWVSFAGNASTQHLDSFLLRADLSDVIVPPDLNAPLTKGR